MSLRPLPPELPPSRVESELDTTAELPVLDAATGAPAHVPDEPHGSSGTWIMPAPARNLGAHAADTGAELLALSARLHDAEELLAGKAERLRQVERARDEALSARAAADERIAALSTQLGEQQARRAALAAQLAEQQTRAVALSAQLAEEQARSAQQAAQLAESARARTAVEQRSSQLTEELSRGRALASAAGERESQLQGRLDTQQRVSREQLAQDLRQREALDAQGRAHVANLSDELQRERARTANYLESLHSVEARRLLAQELVADLQQEADAREAELVRVERELSGRDREASERGAELAQRAARIARLEQQLAAFAEQLAQRDMQLRDTRQEAQGLQTGFARLQTELTAANERSRALEAASEQHAAADTRAQGELERRQSEHTALARALDAARAAAATQSEHTTAQEAALASGRERTGQLEAALQRQRTEGTALATALEAARAAAATQTEQATAQEAALAGGRERIGQLEAALAAEQARAAQLEGELGRVRDEMEDWGGALKSAQHERDGHLAAIATAESRARDLEQRVGLSTEEVRVLQMGSEAVTTRVRELESDLRVAEEAVHRLESEARTRNARLEELEKANQHWRAIEEARHGATDTGAGQALREAARQVSEAAAAPEPAPAPDGTVRLLILQAEGGREIVHVLGRKTSIGRTPDNDVQIDAKFVSRHHAVILAGPAQTIIEDLNSTNGVQINGRRVSRHALKDGDQVAIGRSQYRFAVRKSAEKR